MPGHEPGPLLAREVSPRDRTGVFLPDVWRHRPDESAAVVVDDDELASVRCEDGVSPLPRVAREVGPELLQGRGCPKLCHAVGATRRCEAATMRVEREAR